MAAKFASAPSATAAVLLFQRVGADDETTAGAINVPTQCRRCSSKNFAFMTAKALSWPETACHRDGTAASDESQQAAEYAAAFFTDSAIRNPQIAKEKKS